MGPLQYQKQLRLQEARRLMLAGSRDVTTAAPEVSYVSPSQFNRAYKSLFGLSPLKDIREIQNTPPILLTELRGNSTFGIYMVLIGTSTTLFNHPSIQASITTATLCSSQRQRSSRRTTHLYTQTQAS